MTLLSLNNLGARGVDNENNKLNSGPNDLLIEAEVARILRRSTSAIKRYRLSGKLAFIPGRPVLIARSDLLAFIDNEKRRAALLHQPEAARLSDRERRVEEARAWALKAIAKKRTPR
ncbi:hypothetical protein J2Y55_001118 [Bosea sp. BE125]|uniref:helix-turn-helix domain-containing protein n=1 Tax=Bosea sp. BE125 TaxID=2817909 RepID=UPI00285F3408|nr:helix-turn-helix domain-containing protein [Bosea sp. BE125]MDR6870118.1 hypothetical protein [Bosea sp. BE125]